MLAAICAKDVPKFIFSVFIWDFVYFSHKVAVFTPLTHFWSLRCKIGACKITFDGRKLTVSQVNFSAGNDCLRFLQVTGGNLPAPAGISTAAFSVSARADFFQPKDFYF